MSEVDEEALAEAYNNALALEKQGKHEAAAVAYQKVLELDPADHGGAKVRLASMGQGSIPSKAPDAYVSTLFDQHAEVFDLVLVDQLGYSVPLLVRDRIEKLALGPFKRLLDLGCGTGLTGEALEDLCETRVGVDLSEGMIEIADEKEVYDTLYVSEVVHFLQATTAPQWDIICATDVLPYVGALETFFSHVNKHITDNGVFAFSSETLGQEILNGKDYMVGAFQRFAHSKDYLKKLLEDNGFQALCFEDIIVRYEQGQPVPGYLIVAQSKS
ncbi:methyltransferase [Polycladidibacter stylochi]|uniref:methyltransferase n=1 Tax=Polycladidibacter stylochi TaxID=1807766 RepID=UPI00083584D5|nr:methyltransferase domain-containing protein [Pseudovibrio stylochi]